MKVTLQNGYKDLYTVSDLERAKSVICCLKDDLDKPENYLACAINEYLKEVSGDYLDRVIEAKATTCKNNRVWNRMTDNSCDMDVWIEGIAKTWNGFLEIGAYLSDIWETGSTPYTEHIWTRYYTEER